ISKRGNRYIRRLLNLGAMGVISARKRADPGADWLGRLLAKKPVKVVAIARANRLARAIWGMPRPGEAGRAS
ncbi:MAG: IS110 family transposase, partial [Cereibacter sp.]